MTPSPIAPAPTTTVSDTAPLSRRLPEFTTLIGFIRSSNQLKSPHTLPHHGRARKSPVKIACPTPAKVIRFAPLSPGIGVEWASHRQNRRRAPRRRLLDPQEMGALRPGAHDANGRRAPPRGGGRGRIVCWRVSRPEVRRRSHAVSDDGTLGGLSARNRLHGFIDEVRIDGLLAQVRLRVGDQFLTALITADAVRALKLRRGDDALAIIKSTEVMIAKASGSEVQGRPGKSRKPRR